MDNETSIRRAMQHPTRRIGKALRIFVVEDSPVVRELLIERLQELPDVEVVGSADSEQSAFDALTTTPCDVLIVDIQLRSGTGLGVLRRLAAAPPPAGAPTTKIVFSNFTESEFRRRAERYGAQYFLDKSRGLVSLLEIVEQLAGSASG